MHAIRRKAKIYGRILGYASKSDATHLTGPHREGRGLSDAIGGAMNEAHVKPSGIDYISAHGTGTIYNDLMETKALKSAMGNDAYKISMSSIKSMLGHSFGAAGVMEAVSCLLSMENGVIPPTINYETKDSECDLDYTPNVSRRLSVKTALSISAGFGGQNAAIIFAKD
jgi:3-oxoacyl-(acyl-carrier-protein) synthase